MSMLCPGITIAQICARLGMCNYYYVLGGFFVLYLLALIAAASGSQFMNALIVLLSLFTAVLVGRLRWRVRFLFSLPGSAMEDCIYATFCGCCAIAQMATQVESYTPGSCSIMPRNTLEGYTFA
ncbi:hypothetical protein PINS_up019196 [Pythium insidiosum]|nr:hypothetical protein PINS_up012495 [Pythium insidiosum]GLE08190.1 hypothetical protein PINS_up019196 [Pythium insidiosum]